MCVSPAHPAAGRPLPIRWQQGTAVPPPGWHRTPAGGGAGGEPPDRAPCSPPARGEAAGSCPLAPGPPAPWAQGFFFCQRSSFPATPPLPPKKNKTLWQEGSVFPPGKPAGYIAGHPIPPSPAASWVIHKVLHPLPAATHLPQKPII